MSAPIKISRRDLHNAVWQKGIYELAKEYGVSEYVLRSLCDKHDIPRPGPGHWQLVKRGRAPQAPPLPPSTSSDPVAITRASNWSMRLIDSSQPPSVLKGRSLGDFKIELPADLSNLHKTVRSTRHALKGGHTSYRGTVEPRWNQEMPLDIDVSEQTLPRSLAIMHALLNALDSLKIKVVDKCALIASQKVRFGIYERHDKKPANDEHVYPYRKFDYKPTGVLVFRIIAYKTYAWADEPGNPLEARLSFFLNQILLTADKQQAYDQRIADFNREWQERRDRELQEETARAAHQAELQRQRELELQRRRNLEGAAENWERSLRLTRFLDQCETTLSAAPSAKTAAFLAWARNHAQRLDPFQTGYLQSAIAELPAPPPSP